MPTCRAAAMLYRAETQHCSPDVAVKQSRGQQSASWTQMLTSMHATSWTPCFPVGPFAPDNTPTAFEHDFQSE